jgi:hypothetical protein
LLQPYGSGVVIGATADNGNKLQVTGNSNFTGNVGIGTTSPSALLHVNGGDILAGSNIYGGAGNTTWRLQPQYVNSAPFPCNFRIANGWDPIAGTGQANYAGVGINLNSYQSGSQIEFYTSSTNNAVPTQRMLINSSGYVGIGVTDPGVALQLGAVNNTTSALKIGSFSLQMASYQGLFGSGTVTYTPIGVGLHIAYFAGDTMIFTTTYIGGTGQVSAVTTYMNAATLTGNGGYGQLSLSTSVGGVLTATYKSTGDYLRVFRVIT